MKQLKTRPRRDSYRQMHHGDWLTVVRKGQKIACCDCGLVHKHNFRVLPNGRIEMQFNGDKRATAAVRRERKHQGLKAGTHIAS